MAIEIKRTLDNGIVVLHHRIGRVLSDFTKGEIKVELVSYVKKDIRIKEQKNLQDFNTVEYIRHKLDELTLNPTEENEAERQQLSDQMNAFFDDNIVTISNPQPLAITTTEYSLPATGELSRTEIYEHLKTLPEFAGATDA